MADLKELLVNTAGMARLARQLANEVLTTKIDGDEHGIAIGDTMRFRALRTFDRNRVSLQFQLGDSTDLIQFNDKEGRALFSCLYGSLSAQFEEPLDDGNPPATTLTPDFLEALELLRTAQGVMGEPSEIEGSQEWFDAVDKLLGRHPQGATT